MYDGEKFPPQKVKMLDVHPPEHPAHSWREFFIHIGTICVGLLIALSLEQTVELLHHRHQRRELQEAIQQDNEKALADVPLMERSLTADLDWLNARIAQVHAALNTGAPLTHIPHQHVSVPSRPADRTWEAAKTSNLVEVLPQQDIKAFGEIGSVLASLDQDLNTNIQSVRSHRTAFEQQFLASADAQPDFSKITRPDLVQYLTFLTEERTVVENMVSLSRILRGALTAVTHGERNLDRIDDEEYKAMQEAAHP